MADDSVTPAALFARHEDLSALLWSLQYSMGFVLYFARCNVPAYRQHLVAALQHHFKQPILAVSVREFSDDTTLDVALLAYLQDKPAAIPLFLYDLETLLPTQDTAKQSKTLQQLNWRRNAFSQLQRSLIIWLPEYALTLLAREASDFYDWYSGVFEFDVPETECVSFVQDSLKSFYADTPYGMDGLNCAERQHWQRVLQGLLDELTNDDADTQCQRARLLNDLGRLHQAASEYMQAKLLYERSLAIREETLGKEHIYVAYSLDNLVVLYFKQGEDNQAKPLLERSLAIREKIFGKEHSDVAITLWNLAIWHEYQNNYTQAKELYERALVMYKKFVGDNHPRVQKLSEGYANLLAVMKSMSESDSSE